ncbi:MAG: flagellar hook-basal body complex protein FliE [Paracoccaceae bacterium]
MDLNSINATQRYAASRAATQPSEESGGSVFQNAVADFAKTLANSEVQAKQAMTGDADPHALVQALAQTELAVETAVTVRNKVVEAYQEILRMPV